MSLKVILESVQITFIILKSLGLVNWSWLKVFLPLELYAIYLIILGSLMLLLILGNK